MECQAKDIAEDITNLERRVFHPSNQTSSIGGSLNLNLEFYDRWFADCEKRVQKVELDVAQIKQSSQPGGQLSETESTSNSQSYLRNEIKKIDSRLTEKMERLESDLTEFVSRLKTKDIRIESKLKAIENTMKVKSTSRSKYSRKRTVSHHRGRKGNSFAYPSVKVEKRRNTSSIKHKLSKELYKRVKPKTTKRIHRSIPKAKQKVTYSHDDFENSDLCDDPSTVDKQNVNTFIEECTPERIENRLAYCSENNTYSDHKSGSIKLCDNEGLSDRRMSHRSNHIIEIIDKGSLNYINKKCIDIDQQNLSNSKEFVQNDIMSPNWCTQAVNEENKQPNEQNYSSAKLSKFEQIKSGIRESIEKRNNLFGLSSNTFDCRNNVHIGKENSVNARNITFSKSEQNSTAKSSLSVSNNHKLNKLEQLYNELSMLENSI